MGDFADMVLEGLLDEETGEYIGDINEGIYGVADPGFPVSYNRGNKNIRRQDKDFSYGVHPKTIRVECPLCGKKVNYRGIVSHVKDAHGIS